MSLYRQFRFVAFAAVMGIASQSNAQSSAQAQPEAAPGTTTDSATPADAASGQTTSMGGQNSTAH